MSHDRLQKFREKLKNLSDYSGLKSPGLTCYLNSVLQVLFMTNDFREAVKRCCIQDVSTIDLHLLSLFSELERCTAETSNITEQLGIANVYEQRDAAEYFEKILCMTSLEASKIFRGQLGHRITCCMCQNESESESFFWILPLSVEDSCVKKGLEAFCRTERVLGMYCDHCTRKGDADMRCEVTQNPEILTLLLKRFSFDSKCNRYTKLKCNVDVPQTLQMENCTYDLYALVDHVGNLTGGHYTARIKSYENGGWYHFDDTSVEKVRQPLFGAGNASFGSRTAYLLMYRKVKRLRSERPTGDDREAHLANSDGEAEGRRDEAASGVDPVPQNNLWDRSWNRERHLKQKEIDHDMRTGACVRPDEEASPHRDAAITDKDTYRLDNGFTSQTQNPKDNIHRIVEQTVKVMSCNAERLWDFPHFEKDMKEIRHTESQRGNQHCTQSKERVRDQNTRGSQRREDISGKQSITSRTEPSVNLITCMNEPCGDNVRNGSWAETNVTDSFTLRGGREALGQPVSKAGNIKNHKEKTATKNKVSVNKPPWR
ncbi:ubiquitin carboxyl-terminal hydrolase 47-like isoform X2 [Genypterus blacodes]|uniref:ubiquitin carboxyl-terminal hydrolase 47-like isoform X2 n=1 Tax=Genypterus blacodes TaxID=154954 RepID=UPI003F7587DF